MLSHVKKRALCTEIQMGRISKNSFLKKRRKPMDEDFVELVSAIIYSILMCGPFIYLVIVL